MVNNGSEEIHLLDLLASIVATFKRNVYLVILLPLAGMGTAIVIANLSKPLTESSLVLETSLLSENEAKLILGQMEKKGTISGLTPTEEDALFRFQFEVTGMHLAKEAPMNDSKLDDPSVYINITALVYEPGIYPSLEKALILSINKNPSVIRHRASRETFYQEMIKKINSEIEAMENVKSQVPSKDQASFLNPSELYSTTVNLYEQKTRFELKLQEIKEVHVVKGFEGGAMKAPMNVFVAAAIGFACGLTLLFIILFIKFFAGYYRTYENRAAG